jgi:DNA-binding CsgD family transcriptional regulator
MPDELDALYHAIYEGASESPPWRLALSRLRDSLGAAHVALIIKTRATDAFADESATLSQSYFLLLDPFASLPRGDVATLNDALQRRAQSALESGFLKPGGIRDVLGVDVCTSDGIECRFRATRPIGAMPFTASDKALCATLLPHLERSIRLRVRIDPPAREIHLLDGAPRLMSIGVIDLSGSGRVLGANREAARILAEGDGIWCADGKLRVGLPQEEQALQRMIEVAGSSDGHGHPLALNGLAITRPASHVRLSVAVRAAQNGGDSRGQTRPAAARIYVRAPSSKASLGSTEVLQCLFGLTHPEAELVGLLGEGMALEEACGRLGLVRNVACGHLRWALRKMGLGRQAELTRAIQHHVGVLG